MLQIKDTKVYGLEESIIASGYAMTTEPYKYQREKDQNFSNHLKRVIKLAKCGGGSGHSNFRTGIIVQFDVKYPQYWSMEFQRYHFAQIITSQSKMHRLLKMDLSEMCNEFVTQEAVDNLERLIGEYNLMQILDANDEAFSKEPKEEKMKKQWQAVISNCPMGLEMWMRISLNYEQLATIYKQRRHHKLKEWHVFCDWIETLPYAKELIICED